MSPSDTLPWKPPVLATVVEKYPVPPGLTQTSSGDAAMVKSADDAWTRVVDANNIESARNVAVTRGTNVVLFICLYVTIIAEFI